MRNPFLIAGVGASAGGHESLRKFFSNVPTKSGVAFVVLTHLLRDHESSLAKIIDSYCALPVKRISHGDLVQPDHVYVLPENVECTIRNARLLLKKRDADLMNMCVDTFLFSLADDQSENGIAIIFSGMGSDGARGSAYLHERGGLVLVQDPQSAKFSSMPMATIIKDDPAEVLPPEELALNLNAIIAHRKVYQQR